MAGFAAIRLNEVNPLALGFDIGRNSITGRAGSGKFVGARNLEHGVPVIRGVIMSGPIRVGRDSGLEVDLIPGARIDFGRIHKSVAAGPDRIAGSGQIGNEETATIVSDDFLDIASRQVRGFGDDPDAGFGAVGARDYA